MSFEDATAILADACGGDIDANCRGVNLDSGRLKDCLTRNQDSVTPQCKAAYVGAIDAIAKRVAARAAVRKSCEREAAKLCGAAPKQDAKALACLLTATRGVSANCSRAISEAGYR
jgi:Zn-finger nucleic acid-binding protein